MSFLQNLVELVYRTCFPNKANAYRLARVEIERLVAENRQLKEDKDRLDCMFRICSLEEFAARQQRKDLIKERNELRTKVIELSGDIQVLVSSLKEAV